MKHSKTIRGGAVAATAVLILALINALVPTGATANHEPADKVSAAGSAAIVTGPDAEVILLSELVRTAKPTDLVFSLSLECVITTELTTVGNDSQVAEAQVRAWIEIDGVPVPVSADDPPADRGKITFCDRLDERETTLFDDTNATIRTLQRTGNANAFNWMALDVGSAVHRIEVKAILTGTDTEKADAMAAVGKRTLIVEPTKAANDEEVSAIG